MEKLLNSEIEIIKNKIREYLLLRSSSFLPQITQVLKRPGKLIRASLLLLCANFFKKTDEKILNAAVVIELIHLASLIHDDVLDESNIRRGEDTPNFIWGNRNSILLGDYILSVSLEVLSSKVIDSKNLYILKILAREMKNMIEGEAEDTKRDKNIDEKKYLARVKKKTGALFSAACEIGAYLGSADEEKRKLLQRFGLNCGVAFQITDDILDFTEDKDKLGKPVLLDIRRGNYTLPLIYTLKNSSPKIIKNIINSSDLKHVRKLVDVSGGIDYSRRAALLHLNKAKRDLNIFAPGPIKNTLLNILDFTASRKI